MGLAAFGALRADASIDLSSCKPPATMRVLRKSVKLGLSAPQLMMKEGSKQILDAYQVHVRSVSSFTRELQPCLDNLPYNYGLRALSP